MRNPFKKSKPETAVPAEPGNGDLTQEEAAMTLLFFSVFSEKMQTKEGDVDAEDALIAFAASNVWLNNVVPALQEEKVSSAFVAGAVCGYGVAAIAVSQLLGNGTYVRNDEAAAEMYEGVGKTAPEAPDVLH